jgi:hypothetical protein
MLLLFSGGAKHINIVKKGKPCTILVFDSDLNCIDKQTDTKRLLTVSFVPAAALRTVQIRLVAPPSDLPHHMGSECFHKLLTDCNNLNEERFPTCY